MRISILGKIFIILLSIIDLFGVVRAQVDKTNFYMGDKITLSIEVNGENINFPNITKIGDFMVEGTSSSSQISIINGTTSKTQIKQYGFSPNRSFTIPPFSIEVDGKIETTKPITLTMKDPTPSKSDDPISLHIHTDKSSYYVNEPVVISLVFKYQSKLSIIDAKLAPFNPKGFWPKEMPSPKPKEENGYIIYEVKHLLFPKKSGTIKIPNHHINIAKRDFRNYIKWEKIFSNPLNLDIKPLPNNINMVGDFTLTAKVDKNQVDFNEPVNLTIQIEGSGNIDDIKSFNLPLKNQVLYNSKPQIQSNIIREKPYGEFIQKISIISEEDYTIPPITFSYFDLKTQTVKTKTTQAIEIKVNQITQKESPKIETLSLNTSSKTPTQIKYIDKDPYTKYIFGLIGFMIGAFLTWLVLAKKKVKEIEDTPLIKQIKQAKNNKALYDILLPYIQDNTINQYVKLLEENIFKNKNNTINKKSLILFIRENFEL